MHEYADGALSRDFTVAGLSVAVGVSPCLQLVQSAYERTHVAVTSSPLDPIPQSFEVGRSDGCGAEAGLWLQAHPLGLLRKARRPLLGGRRCRESLDQRGSQCRGRLLQPCCRQRQPGEEGERPPVVGVLKGTFLVSLSKYCHVINSTRFNDMCHGRALGKKLPRLFRCFFLCLESPTHCSDAVFLIQNVGCSWFGAIRMDGVSAHSVLVTWGKKSNMVWGLDYIFIPRRGVGSKV